MACPSVEQLRQLQSSLNASIDAYTDACSSSNGISTDAQRELSTRVSRDAAAIERMTDDPAVQVLTLGNRPIVNTAARVALDLNLFEFITEKTSIDELVSKSNGEKALIVRILRPLVAARILDEPSPTTYSSTDVSRTLRQPGYRDWVKTCFDSLLPIWCRIPDYIRQNYFTDITSPTDNPSTLVHGVNFFQALSQNPQLEHDFASAMSVQDRMPKHLVAQYPFSDAISSLPPPPSNSTGPRVLIVDVGGGNGTFLARIHASYPTLQAHGQNILQDLPTVIATVDPSFASSNNFEATAHDFFTPNPIHGARWYYLRGIMLDWSDDNCRKILMNLRGAMIPGYSSIIIEGHFVREIGYGSHEAQMDMTLMVLAGKERTFADYKGLLESVGMKIVKVIEAEEESYRKCIEVVIDEDWKADGPDGLNG